MAILSDDSDSHAELVADVLRKLQDIHHRGRAVLTVLYLCVLSLCFLIPFFFYVRMHCDDRRNRQLLQLEIATITQSLTESQPVQREEARATRRKYREERRARILQLFGPVRAILKEENFVGAEKSDPSTPKPLDDDDDDEEDNDDVEAVSGGTVARTGQGGGDGGEEGSFVLVPRPGLPSCALLDFLISGSNSYNNLQASSHSANKQRLSTTTTNLRQVPIECAICLCEYDVGSDVVWSSNPQCEHVFHKNCIEQWLMKQRDGPLCPCCRRDFVIDPFDDAEALIETVPTDITDDSGVGANVTIQTIDSDAMSGQLAGTPNDISTVRTPTN